MYMRNVYVSKNKICWIVRKKMEIFWIYINTLWKNVPIFFDISIWNYNNLITENNVMQIDDTS